MKKEYQSPKTEIIEIMQPDDLLVIHYSRLTGHADPQVKHLNDTPESADNAEHNSTKWGDLW